MSPCTYFLNIKDIEPFKRKGHDGRPFNRAISNALRPHPFNDPFMKKNNAKSVRVFVIELAIYAVLVTVYFFLVLHLLGNWLYRLEMQHRIVYAVVAILLIAGQAVVLDALATLLFR